MLLKMGTGASSRTSGGLEHSFIKLPLSTSPLNRALPRS
jgi:hypothetical protein